MASGRGPLDRDATGRRGACLTLYILGSGTTTRAIWSIFGSDTSSDGGSWANASRTRALADISADTAGAGAGVTACATFGAGRTGTGALATVGILSNTIRSGNFRSEWIRTGGNSVAEVRVPGRGSCGSTTLARSISDSSAPPT